MNLPKAIELLKEQIRGTDQHTLPDHILALRLGIVGLDSIKRNRANNLPNRYSLLPGETEE